MSPGYPVPAAVHTAAFSTAAQRARITFYGCGREEAALLREMAPRLGVHPTLTESPVSEANIALAYGNRCISVGHGARVTNPVLRALGRAGVQYVSTRSIGIDHIDVEFAESVGITVGNVTYSPGSVADYTLMLMLMALRRAKTTILRTDAHDYRLSGACGRELGDLTVGVVGTGRIGQAVIERLRGFGCSVLAHDRHPKTAAEYVPLGELLRRSDIVTLHTPLTGETHHLLDRPRIEQMKRGALIVNTGRGGLVDTHSLLSALESGRLGGAALDVIEGEEGVFYTDNRNRTQECDRLMRLQRMPNVLVTPHTAYYTSRALREIVENSLINCLEFTTGRAA